MLTSADVPTMKWLFLFLGMAILGPEGIAQNFPPHSSSTFIPNTPGSTNAPPTLPGAVIIETIRPGMANLPAVPHPDTRTSRTWDQAPLQVSVLTHPSNYSTENNWLASIVARRIVDFARLANGPAGASLPEITVKAEVDTAASRIHLEIGGFSSAPVTADLQPEFIWDAHGYAPLAAKLLKSPAASSAVTPPDELTILQNLTGPTLAHEDVALSTLLKKQPASAATHDDAALLLVALALRDNAGEFADSRRMLGRATGHLALAEALRGRDAPTWAGKIADAGIRALAGREVDALAHLDALESAADCPDAAKPWITALRLRAKDDWRLVTPHPTAPLLLKIAWFQVLSNNLSDLLAIKQFEATDEFAPVTDWGHAVPANGVQTSVEGENRSANRRWNRRAWSWRRCSTQRVCRCKRDRPSVRSSRIRW